MPVRSVFVTRLAAFFSLLLACSGASAFPVTWTLSGVTFADGGTASGSFVYDAATNNVSDILDTFSISVAGGDTATFPAITYDPSNASAFVADHGGGDYGAIFSLNGLPPQRGIRIPAISELTDAGGTLAVNIAGSGAGECYNCGPYRAFAGGNLIGTAAPLFASAMSVTVDLSTPITFVVRATGAPVPTLTLTGALPANVSFVDNGDGTGSFAGTAIESGTYPVVIVASNGIAPDATQAFTLIVSPPAPVLPVPTLGGFGLFACALLLLLVARKRIASRCASMRR